MKILDRAFYERETITVAKELLGKLLVKRTIKGDIKLRYRTKHKLELSFLSQGNTTIRIDRPSSTP